MTITLYEAVVPTYLQVLQAAEGLLVKAHEFADEKGVPLSELIQWRLADDMLPFASQIKFAHAHSAGAVAGIMKGVFTPDMTPPADFDAVRDLVCEATNVLEALDPAELNGRVGHDMRFEVGERRMEFTVEDYLLSFAQPNFYFHVTTAYDILRWKGVNLGKRDYMGQLRMKG